MGRPQRQARACCAPFEASGLALLEQFADMYGMDPQHRPATRTRAQIGRCRPGQPIRQRAPGGVTTPQHCHAADITVSAATRHHASPVNKYRGWNVSFIAICGDHCGGFSRRRDRRAHHQCGRGRPGQRAHRPAGPFFSESWEHKLPPPGADGRVFGVYSGYASDQHGAFDVTAGVAARQTHQALGAPPRWTLAPAPTWCFEPRPDAPLVIDAWGAVWRYFADHPQVQRRFGTDSRPARARTMWPSLACGVICC